MKTMTNAGALELRTLYQRNAIEGLMIAALFHFVLIGSFQLFSKIIDPVRTTDQRIHDRIIFIDRIPAWFNDGHAIPNINVIKTITSNIGVPIPIPDPEINPEATIANQHQMTESQEDNGTIEGGTGTTSSEGKTIVLSDERPMDFIPGIEKYPEIISNPPPAYPDLARRAGVEGTVYIKMWVTKEGKVKTAEVVKSTSDLFNTSAINAAMLWTFTPAIMNSNAVSVWVTVPFKFRLRSN